MKWILLILFPLVRSLEESFQGDVLCSVSDYVKVGLEFEACYKSAFSQLDLEKRPCKTLKKVVERCADTVKKCFSARGYERGLQIMFDSVAVNYPEVNGCDIKFDKDKLAEKKPGERCSVEEEIKSIHNVTVCTTAIQAKIVNVLADPKTNSLDGESDSATLMVFSPSSTAKTDKHFLFCDSLMNIRDSCMVPNMARCYHGHDLDAHLAYLIETLKVTSSVIASTTPDVRNVADCPVFATSNHNETKSITSVTIIAVLSATLALFAVASLALLAYKLRVVPRLKAWARNLPYDDMLVGGEGGGSARDDVAEGYNESAMQRRSSERELEESKKREENFVNG